MEIPAKIRFAAERLQSGHRVNRITVRDFLRHFGAERRGATKVESIRRILDELDLETEPDFSTAWIDAPLWLRKKTDESRIENTESAGPGNTSSFNINISDAEEMILEGTPEGVEQADEQSEAAPISADDSVTSPKVGSLLSSIADPTYRIGSLPAANRRLVVVSESDSLVKAVTLMLQHDFSQLPVMQGERSVKGVVTWKSIAAKNALGTECKYVRDCREEHRIVDSNRTLFDAIPTIVQYGYVLVRDQKDQKITGIVTASDLSLQFQSLAEPFLLLREVELHVRQLLDKKITQADIDALTNGVAPARKVQHIDDLTFGQYVRLFQHPAVWSKLELRIDPGVLTSLLEEVRVIRNDVMHFDPDPMTSEELGTLKRASQFMQDLYELLP